MPRQTRVSVSKTVFINAYGAARKAQVDNDNERLAVFMNSVLESPKVKGTPLEAKLRKLTVDEWKGKVTVIRSFLAANTAAVDGKVRFIYPKTTEVKSQKEIQDNGETKTIPVIDKVVSYYLDPEFKQPLPEDAKDVTYPALWGRTSKTKKDRSDLISAIESMDAAIVSVG